ncbi:MAG: response regulator [Chloroflexi bacterium]|nr:response regulator [Chloroflexota bacterium]MDA1226975.1 response regulator [Chloroflexota bacterium]
MRRFAFKPTVTLILAVNMALFLLAASAVLTALDVRRESLAFAEQVEVRGISLSTAVTDAFAVPISSGDAQMLADVVRETRVRRELAYLVVFSADGKPLSKELDSEFYAANDGFGSNAVYTETVTQRAQGALIEFASPVMLGGKAIAGVQYGFSTEPLKEEISTIITQRVWQTAILGLAGVAASVLMSRMLIGPVRRITGAVHRVSDGGKFVHETKGVSEFAQLSSAVGEMVAKLRSASQAAPAQATSEANSPASQAPESASSNQASAQQAAAAPSPSGQVPVQPIEGGFTAESQQFLIDAQKKLDDALNQAKVAEDAAQMATKSAHTINNLVTPITAYSKMAREKLPEGSPLISHMAEIEEAGNRIAQLATQIQMYVPEAPLIEVTNPVTEETMPKASVEDVIENNVVIDQNSTVALVVDDESVVRRVTTSILTAEGYTVLEASNGIEAAEIGKRFINVPFRLLVTDVLMPMMGAKDLAAIMGDIHPETLVVYTSGYTAESLIAHGAMDSKATFIPKPLTREHLLNKIDEAVLARTNEINEATNAPAPSV